jgi:hypothetical protein
MTNLRRQDLWTLEEYATRRPEFRRQVMEHKKSRQLSLGDNAKLYFEDQLTIKYQVQEMLRIERIFEPEGIQDELDTYNPLIPDGSNLKATFMLEYVDPAKRAQQLGMLIGIEKTVWLQAGDYPRVYPICDEDLAREDDEKTSSVHFMRFEFSEAMIRALKEGAALTAGIACAGYPVDSTEIPDAVRTSLINDLDPVS